MCKNALHKSVIWWHFPGIFWAGILMQFCYLYLQIPCCKGILNCMKLTACTLLILYLLLAVAGCKPGTHNTGPPKQEQGLHALMDSLELMDSMVMMYKVSDNNLALACSEKALLVARELNTKQALAKALLLKGVAKFHLLPDSGYFYYSQALKMARESGNTRLLPALFYNIASCYEKASDLKKAILYLDSAISIAEKNQDFSSLSNAMNILGNMKLELGDTLAASRLYDSACMIAQKHQLRIQYAIALVSKVQIEQSADRADSISNVALRLLHQSPGYEDEIAQILINTGLRKVEPDSAITYFESALRILGEKTSPQTKFGACNNMAYSYMDKGDFAKAAKILVENAIPLAEKNADHDWLATLYDSYADALVGIHKPYEAIRYEKKAVAMREIADGKKAAGQVRLLSALLDARNRELTIAAKENEVQRKEVKNRMLLFLLTLSLLVFLIIVATLIFRMQLNSLKYKENQVASAKAIIELEESRKGLLAMELHDIASPFYLEISRILDQSEIQDTVYSTDIRSTVKEMSQKIREISHRINADTIRNFSLEELITGLCSEIRRTTKLEIKLEMAVEDYPLQEEQKLHLYRIAQELLANAAKYVVSGVIRLDISAENNHFMMMYEDLGKGFDESEIVNNGLGIRNIKARAQILQGKADLLTSPGKGTSWNIIIPL